MKVLSLDLPAMYGDHHVVEVKRLLIGLEGVKEVYASSGFQAADITYNAKKVAKKDIVSKLDGAGYIGELLIPEESGIAVNVGDSGAESFYRHTEAYAQTGKIVSFGQDLVREGRGLWPCPGMSPMTSMDEE